jgi:predicted metal-dependent phosphoesterase TrpH
VEPDTCVDPVTLERHPHLGEPRPAGTVRVDMHSHTMWSGDCTTTPDELRAAVEACRIDVLCITDHNAVAGARRLVDELPCRVVIGEELRVGQGELIGLFLTEAVPLGLPLLDTAKAIRDQGGVVYVPHPFDPMRNCLTAHRIDSLVEAGLVDAFEVRNAKTSLESLNRRAAAYAAEHGLLAGAGSDAHVPAALGAAYVEMPDFTDAASFLVALGSGRIVGHHSDPPRPWTPRIVPSVPDER